MSNESSTKRIPFTDYKANVQGNRSEDEAIAEIQREVEVRKRIYDRWVSEGRLSWVDANDRLSRLLTALRHFTGAKLLDVTTSGELPMSDEAF